jgi:dihydrofolate reductase
VAHSLTEALALVADAPKAFVMGGGQLYAEALPLADELVLTEVDKAFEADTFFPEWNKAVFTEVSHEAHLPASPGDIGFAFVTYRRIVGG